MFFFSFLVLSRSEGGWEKKTSSHWSYLDEITSLTSQHILRQTDDSLFTSQAPSSHPQCILFVNAWGSGSSKTGVSQPRVTGQELCQGQECKQWTESDCRNASGSLMGCSNCYKPGHVKSRSAPPLEELLCNVFPWLEKKKCERGCRKWEGRQAMEGGRRIEWGAF